MSGSDNRVTRRLVIAGDVQGVSFRDWATEEARRHGLDGYVRNLEDGTVEAVVSGPEQAVAQFAKACEDGSDAADVKGVSASEAEDPGLNGFERRPTA